MWAQRRLTEACASAQSDQSLYCTHEEILYPWLSRMRPGTLLMILREKLRESAGWSGPEVIKLFSCSTEQSMKFHMVIKIKIPTVHIFFMLTSAEHAQLSLAWKKFQNFVSILIFISKKFMLNWVEHEKRFITSGPESSLVHLLT